MLIAISAELPIILIVTGAEQFCMFAELLPLFLGHSWKTLTFPASMHLQGAVRVIESPNCV